MRRRTRWGRNLALTTGLVSFTLMGGCALPVGVQVASWVADGVSYIATEKSLTDHGISFVFGEDCALHRLITDDGNVCSPTDDSITTVVDAGSSGDIVASSSASALTTSDDLIDSGAIQLAAADDADVLEPDDISSLAEFETAAGNPERQVASVGSGGLFSDDNALPGGSLIDSSSGDAAPLQVVAAKTAQNGTTTPIRPIVVFDTSIEPSASPVVFAMTARLPSARSIKTDTPTIASAIVADAQAPIAAFAVQNTTAAARASTMRVREEASLAPGRYVVIGSFRGHTNAARFTERHASIGAQFIAIETAAQDLYRVVVGPITTDRKRLIDQHLVSAGLTDVWVMGISAGDAIVAVGTHRPESIELAEISG